MADGYKGTHISGSEYFRGDTCTHGGSLWLCEKDTKGRPGQTDAWRLIVKRGAPGKAKE